MKKKIILYSLLSLLASNLIAADYDYMVFTLKDGTTQSIPSMGLVLSFEDGNMKATNGSQTITIPLTSLDKMAFSDDTTGIETIENTQMTIDDNAEIFDLQGRMVTKDQMQKGIYIIKTNNRTYKMLVK